MMPLDPDLQDIQSYVEDALDCFRSMLCLTPDGKSPSHDMADGRLAMVILNNRINSLPSRMDDALRKDGDIAAVFKLRLSENERNAKKLKTAFKAYDKARAAVGRVLQTLEPLGDAERSPSTIEAIKNAILKHVAECESHKRIRDKGCSLYGIDLRDLHSWMPDYGVNSIMIGRLFEHRWPIVDTEDINTALRDLCEKKHILEVTGCVCRWGDDDNVPMEAVWRLGEAGLNTGNDVGRKVKPQTSKSKKRGRKPDTDLAKDRMVSEAWNTGHYRTKADLARELGEREDDVRRAIDRHRKRL